MRMFDLDALRGEVLHFQSRERRYWEYDPCALRARLETCPPDAPLCIAWAYAAAGRLDGMMFAAAEDEPLVGRVRRAARSPEEFRAAAQILFSDNFSSAFSAEDIAVVGDVLLNAMKGRW